MVILSVHGREHKDLAAVIRSNPKVALFTGGRHSPDSICRLLAEKGLGDVAVSVGENLSYENERVVCGTPAEIGRQSFNSLSLMIVGNSAVEGAGRSGYSDGGGYGKSEEAETEEIPGQLWRYTTPGIPDSMFIRGEVPMTKEEVRAAAISKLRLTGNETVYDIGAGTGSVSVECALICKSGRVYAVEKEDDALELIRKNTGKFKTRNVEIIAGNAPLACERHPAPDRVFIGGSGGKMEEIVRWAGSSGKPVRIVINTVVVESTAEALSSLEKEGFENIEIISLSAARGRRVGGKHMMQAMNPVYIISADKSPVKEQRNAEEK
jgi:precorrin-6Y C5,15-methyltransferase (decarboxylating)